MHTWAEKRSRSSFSPKSSSSRVPLSGKLVRIRACWSPSPGERNEPLPSCRTTEKDTFLQKVEENEFENYQI